MKRKPLTIVQAFADGDEETRRQRLQKAVDGYLRLALEAGLYRRPQGPASDGGDRL